MYSSKDIKVSSAGDLLVDDTGDLTLGSPQDSFTQMLDMRIKTSALEMSLSPYFGCNIRKFLGKPNTSDTGKRIEQAIVFGLTNDGFISNENLTVDVVPVSLEKVAALIKVNEIIVNDDFVLEKRLPYLAVYTIGLTSFTVQRVTGTTE
jgi:hypothetical protein